MNVAVRPQLDGQQRAAVERTEQDVCVVAGPGSGKTRVLTERFHWLIETGLTTPERILAITFTEKAAAEIKSRLVATIDDNLGLRRSVERAYVSTIHGFCSRLLREHAVAAAVDIDFSVLGEVEGPSLLEACAEEALDELFRRRPMEMRRLMEAVDVSSRRTDSSPDLAAALVDVYEAIRAAGASLDAELPPSPTPAGLTGIVALLRETAMLRASWKTPLQGQHRDGLLEWAEKAAEFPAAPITLQHFQVLALLPLNLQRVPQDLRPRLKNARDLARAQLVTGFYGPLRLLLLETLRELDARYADRKGALSSLDFTDLEQKSLDLLRQDASVREAVRAQFEYILMDELQDTNPLQWEILNQIRRPGRFFAVGDINQSIYGFRYAEPELFARYQEALRKNGHPIDEISGNYRSRREILDAVAWLVSGQPGIEERQLVAERKHDPSPDPVVEVLVVRAPDSEGPDLEPAWIAHRIGELVRNGEARYRQIAVLARKLASLEPIAVALRQTGIPYTVTAGRRLLETREARDIGHLTRALANIRDEIPLAGILRSQMVGLRDDTLLRLRILRSGLWAGLAAAAEEPPSELPADDAERISWFVGLWRRLRASRDELPPDRLVYRVLDETGYLGTLDAQGRANVDKILALLREKWEAAPFSAAGGAALFDKLRTRPSEGEAPPEEASDSVRLMTMHKAKGLEFPVVFVPSLHSQTQSETPPVCFSRDGFFGVKWRDPETGKGAGDVCYEAVRESLKEKSADEEWRLLYVAMTRAERRLILSWNGARRSTAWVKHLRALLAIDPEVESECETTIPGKDTRLRIVVKHSMPPPARVTPAEILAPEPLLLPRPALDDQHDSAVSVTHLSTFAACPRKYYLSRYLALDTAPVLSAEVPAEDTGDAEAPDAATLGSQVHMILAGSPPAAPAPEAKALASVFEGSDLAARVRRAARVEREFDFLVDLPPALVRGQIDLWFEGDGQTFLVDYKTDSFHPDEEPERLRPYQLQLQIYALALERLLGRRPTGAWLFFLRSATAVEVTLSETLLDRARGMIAELAEAQQQVNFPLSEGDQCYRCSFYRGACPAGRIVRSLL